MTATEELNAQSIQAARHGVGCVCAWPVSGPDTGPETVMGRTLSPEQYTLLRVCSRTLFAG